MRNELKKDLEERIATELHKLSDIAFLKEISIDSYFDEAVSILYLYTRVSKVYKRGNKKLVCFTEVCATIGRKIMALNGLKRDSLKATRAGAFFIYTFDKFGILEIYMERLKQDKFTYRIRVLKENKMRAVWKRTIGASKEKLPSNRPYAPWVSATHEETGTKLVKTESLATLNYLSPKTHPMVFKTINKAQNTGWLINSKILEIQRWAFKEHKEVFNDIWKQVNPTAKRSKILETETIFEIAEKVKGRNPFYHLYFYDFRGRKYCTTAYLHEQGADTARGLLLRHDRKEIGLGGFNWLLISLANNWGNELKTGEKTDKLPLKEKIKWAKTREATLLTFAENPKERTGWMKADKPWQFLAACFELRKLRIWQARYGQHPSDIFQDYSYKSHLEVFIDGTINGNQHLAALTRDETVAPLVNLCPSDKFQDLYLIIGGHVWESIAKECEKMSKEERTRLNEIIDILLKRKMAYKAMSDKERKENKDFVHEARVMHCDDIKKAAPLFWNRIHSDKERRKIVKRNVMTISYGSTEYGMGTQQIDDACKHGIELLEFMERSWGVYMGRKAFSACGTHMAKSMELLALFKSIGFKADQTERKEGEKGVPLAWTVPITHFPVIQYYVEAEVKKKWVQYGPPKGTKLKSNHYENTLQLNISFTEIKKFSGGHQEAGIAPNIVHSLDAAHLMIIVNKCDFNVTTIHDAFGCLLADMPILYKVAREAFVELYEKEPLFNLLEQLGVSRTKAPRGRFNIREVLESPFSFS